MAWQLYGQVLYRVNKNIAIYIYIDKFSVGVNSTGNHRAYDTKKGDTKALTSGETPPPGRVIKIRQKIYQNFVFF